MISPNKVSVREQFVSFLDRSCVVLLATAFTLIFNYGLSRLPYKTSMESLSGEAQVQVLPHEAEQ